MRLLLIHQNFPGQFRSLIPAFLARGHELVGLGARALLQKVEGLRYLNYEPSSAAPMSLAAWWIPISSDA